MPYIPENRRPDLMPRANDVANSPGELNFQFTELAETYRAHHGTSYQTINDILGALEGAKLEAYRRVAAPYENDKIVKNSDVYFDAESPVSVEE
jgi:hypothetical protein